MKIKCTYYSYIAKVIFKVKNELLPDQNQTYQWQFVKFKLDKHIILTCYTQQSGK